MKTFMDVFLLAHRHQAAMARFPLPLCKDTAMPIIDFRFRPHTPEAVATINAKHPIYGAMFTLFKLPERLRGESLTDIVASLRALNVVKAVVTGRDAESTFGVPSGNDGVLELMEAFPDLFIGFAGLDPHKGMTALRELKQRAAQGMRGASIDPYMAKIPADHALFYPLYAACCELDIPMVVTTGAATLIPGVVMDDTHPRHLDRVATDFPELRLVLSHAGYPFVAETLMMVQRHPNVYLELSEYERMPFAEAYFTAANTFLGDRILFASAHPFNNVRDHIALYDTLPFSDAVRPLVMHDNAARLLKL